MKCLIKLKRDAIVLLLRGRRESDLHELGCAVFTAECYLSGDRYTTRRSVLREVQLKAVHLQVTYLRG